MRLATFETRRAEEAGLERQAIVKMARRVNPEALDFDQTLTELENAVEVALDVIAKGERGTNLDAFVDAVLGLVAEKTRTGEFDSASRVPSFRVKKLALGVNGKPSAVSVGDRPA